MADLTTPSLLSHNFESFYCLQAEVIAPLCGAAAPQIKHSLEKEKALERLLRKRKLALVLGNADFRHLSSFLLGCVEIKGAGECQFDGIRRECESAPRKDLQIRQGAAGLSNGPFSHSDFKTVSADTKLLTLAYLKPEAHVSVSMIQKVFLLYHLEMHENEPKSKKFLFYVIFFRFI